MDFVDCIPKNNINFRIILQKIIYFFGLYSTKLPACLRGIEWENNF